MEGLIVTADDMLDEVVEVLEENGAYYNFGRDEWSRHFPAPEMLDALGFLVTTVALPILTNVLSDELKEKLKVWRRAKQEEKSRDMQEAIDRAGRGPEPQQEAQAAAVEAVSALLRRYGWPPREADADAERIVHRICRSLWEMTNELREPLRRAADARLSPSGAVGLETKQG